MNKGFAFVDCQLYSRCRLCFFNSLLIDISVDVSKEIFLCYLVSYPNKVYCLYHLILLFSLTLSMRLLINQADHLAMLLKGCRKVSWKKNVQF